MYTVDFTLQRVARQITRGMGKCALNIQVGTLYAAVAKWTMRAVRRGRESGIDETLHMYFFIGDLVPSTGNPRLYIDLYRQTSAFHRINMWRVLCCRYDCAQFNFFFSQ